ncbi:MAG TPA: fatty acid desaturase [Vicinamibacterales bacterium]|nr:fatty acid desaturase [Vicinamibacterales bacterium]
MADDLARGVAPDGDRTTRLCGGRTRGSVLLLPHRPNFLSYDMFHHVEHHLFPAVPTCRLPELSRRLDLVAPHYKDFSVY